MELLINVSINVKSHSKGRFTGYNATDFNAPKSDSKLIESTIAN